MPPPKDLSSARRTVRLALVTLVVVILAGFVASRIDLHEYSMTPGGAQPVGPLISIDGVKAPKGGGHILLTDVLLTPLSLLTWLPAHLGTATEIIPEDALVPSGQDPADLDAQGYLDMEQSKDAARTAALRRLGYPVTSTDAGALVTAVGTDTPAADRLHVADVIVGVDGRPVSTSCELISAIHDDAPGTKVALRVRPAEISDSGKISNGPATTVSIALQANRHAGRTSTGCPGVEGPSRAILGVAIETDRHWHYPFSIQISTPNIGGPSAGLAMTLGIIDSLSHGHLLRSSTIAATGTMSPDGAVGDVGGVEQKAVAVSRARASVFLVPGNEGPTARKTAAPGLKVVPVTTLDQALRLLLARGGSLTLADGSVEKRDGAAAGS
jgi:PDZ domain-containing protein